MPLFDAADCLEQFNQLTGRPATDQITDTLKYRRLARAQQLVVARLASVFPEALYPKVGYQSIPTLTTTDNQVFTFGSGGTVVTPIGRTMIYTSLDAIPDSPWVEGVDYLWETTQIRIPNNQTYDGTLYYRGAVQPVDIAVGVDPSLEPLDARVLIVEEAARKFLREGGRNLVLAADLDNSFADHWAEYCLMWRTAYAQGGALMSFTGRQLAILSQ